MKMNRISLWTAVALGSLVAFAPLSRADEEKKPKKPAGEEQAREGQRGEGQRGDRLKPLAEALSLTDAQKEKIKPILQAEGEKLKALREDSSLSREDKMAKFKEIREATAAKIKPLLTAEQAEKLAKLQEQGPRGPRR